LSEELKKLLVDTIIDDATLQGFIGTRVYPANMFAARDLTFPCINYVLTGGEIDPHAPKYFIPRIEFWILSQKHYKECWQIYETFYDLMAREKFKTSTLAAQMRLSTYPGEDYEDVSKTFIVMFAADVNLIRLS